MSFDDVHHPAPDHLLEQPDITDLRRELQGGTYAELTTYGKAVPGCRWDEGGDEVDDTIKEFSTLAADFVQSYIAGFVFDYKTMYQPDFRPAFYEAEDRLVEFIRSYYNESEMEELKALQARVVKRLRTEFHGYEPED